MAPTPGLVGHVRYRLRPLRRLLVGPITQVDRPRAIGAIEAVVERAATCLEPPARVLTALGPPPGYHLASVYRRRNAGVIERLVDGSSADVLLWALDMSSPDLADRTVGTGPGTRFTNLNRTLAARADTGSGWLVLADDDVRLDRGTLDQAVSLAAAAGLDIAQPSHSPSSWLNWSVCRHRVGSTVRLTRYVDQGPLLILSPAAQQRLLPLPEDMGMGFGVETLWATYRDLRIGFLDAVLMCHLDPVRWTGKYDVRAECERAEKLLHHYGWVDWEEIQKEIGRWPSWRSAPPWSIHPASSGC